MKKAIQTLTLLLAAYGLLLTAAAQNGHIRVDKIDPPNWWAGMTINPVRLLIRGEGFYEGTQLVAPRGSGLTVSNITVSRNGHYLFADITVAPNTKPGRYELRAGYGTGFRDFEFEIKPRMSREGRFRGFTPDDVIYFAIPDRFADGDISNNDPAKSKGLYDRKQGRLYHGGDLQGLIDHLGYIKSLGVTAIWTTPFYDNNDKPDYKEVYPGMAFTTGYHGYGAVDMYGIDEHLGNEAKLHEFVTKAQAMGFKVIQDQVVNHTGPYHVWADDPPTPTWWNGTVKNHLNNNWQKWTTMDPRATYQIQRSNIEGWFIDILPDFNQKDPEVAQYLIQHTIWWVENYGFDAIRMDTLPHVPRSFWAKWMAAVKKEYPHVNVLGELFDPDPVLVSYFQTGRRGHDGIDTGIETLYDFPIYYQIRSAFARGGSIRNVSQMFARDWLYPNPDVLTTFLGVHDVERFMNEPGATTDGLMLAQTLIMTSRGTPLLYYGDEIAMPGGTDPDNRRDFPGGFAGDARNAFTREGRTADENRVWDHLARLGKLRKELEPLRNGKTLDLFDADQQMAYARLGKGAPEETSPAIVVFNNDAKPAEVEFQVTPDTKCYSENEFVSHYWWADSKDIKRLWLFNGYVLVDRLGDLGEVKIDCGMFKITMPPRTAGIFTKK